MLLPALLPLMIACGRSRPPDVVVVLVDTLRADGPSYAGNPRPTTPNLDALASTEATWFSRAYAASSWTLPATTSLLTGRYPWEHRVVRAADDTSHFGRLSADVPTLATAFKGRGYRTAAFINNAFLAPEFRLDQGFDVYDYVGANTTEHRSADDTVTAALGWLGAEDTPAFLLVHVMEPHFEYAPPADLLGRFSGDLPHTITVPVGGEEQDAWQRGASTPAADDQRWLRALYDEEILATDRAIGALLDGLRARKGWKTTRLVVTADHGEELWDHGGFEHGHTTRSPVTHIPLLIRAPGVPAGRNDSVVDHVAIHDFIDDGEGDVAELAAAGRLDAGRLAFTEDILYGPQQIGAVSQDVRLVLDLGARAAFLWEVGADGVEGRTLHDDPTTAERGRPLHAALVARRGGLEPTQPDDPSTISDFETFNQLKELGYLDR